MLDKREVSAEIEALERRENHSASIIATLANLYTVRDHLDAQDYDVSYSSAVSPMPQILDEYGDSDFLRAVAGKNSADAWAIMDNLMDTLRVVNIRVYDSVLQKIKSL